MRRLSARWLFPLLLLLPACRDGEPSPAALWDLWPNGDGASWTYEYLEYAIAEPATVPLYPTVAEVPPAPTLQEAAALLGAAVPQPSTTQGGVYRMGFEGNVTTESGVTAQHLVASLEPVAARRSPDAPDTELAPVLLARLRAARPDLRARLDAAGTPEPRTERGASSLQFRPLFLDGYAWARTTEWIGGYGDLDQQPSWRYVEADFRPGHEFSLQLVPAVANDAWLHSRVLARATVETPAGIFENAVVCLYLVDYGIGTVTDATGVLTGYARTLSIGTVAYAPGVGPVAGDEYPFAWPGPDGLVAVGPLTLRLTESRLPR